MGESQKNRLKIGLALGGGGARGFTHLGILKVLDEAGLRVDLFAGTSMGALAAALYLRQGSAEAAISHLQHVHADQRSVAQTLSHYTPTVSSSSMLRRLMRRALEVAIINRAIHRSSLLTGKYLTRAIEELISPGRLEDLPLAVAATDLISGKGVVLRTGSLQKALLASAAIPGFFPPVQWDDMLLTDGEVTDLIPVAACRAMGADVVLAVDPNSEIHEVQAPRTTLDVLLRAFNITTIRLGEASLPDADLTLHPVQGEVMWSDFHKLEEMISQGEAAAREQLPQIQELLSGRREPKIFNQEAFRRTHIIV
jgi:NTE family protein